MSMPDFPWITIEEDTPTDPTEKYIVRSEVQGYSYYTMARWSSGCWIIAGQQINYNDVTHWALIPVPQGLES